ncbi:hypothetical protein EG867_16165 [Enterococcus faecalis]|nr:hypothetical protein EG867_16165 [Enterococcus faecalis]
MKMVAERGDPDELDAGGPPRGAAVSGAEAEGDGRRIEEEGEDEGEERAEAAVFADPGPAPAPEAPCCAEDPSPDDGASGVSPWACPPVRPRRRHRVRLCARLSTAARRALRGERLGAGLWSSADSEASVRSSVCTPLLEAPESSSSGEDTSESECASDSDVSI